MSKEKITLIETLHDVQTRLKAPKGQKNEFGGYKYRSCEDILEAVKKILPSGVSVLLSDDIQMIGERFYVKATASLISSNDQTINVTAFARESLDKKGMDSAQITGAASSYARKYALNGLFLIDDTKDADATNDGKDEPKEYTREDKMKQRDMAYDLALTKTVEDVDSFLSFYDPVPDFISDAAANKKTGLNNNVLFPPAKYGFIDVEEALAFGVLAKKNIEEGPIDGLEDWISENDAKIKGLDSMLKAAKYNKDGTPSGRLFKAYDKRIKLMEAAE